MAGFNVLTPVLGHTRASCCQDEGSKFQEDERTQIKTLIVDLMCAVPPSTQRQVRFAVVWRISRRLCGTTLH